MTKIRITTVLIAILWLVSACGPSEVELAATEEVISNTQQAQSTMTMSVKQTSEFATQQFNTQLANTAQAATSTEAFIATKTSASATEQQRQHNISVTRTAQAGGIYEIVQALYDAGHITKTEGSFQKLPYFNESWAQLGWVRSSLIDDSYVKDFVLVVDVSWESASRSAEFYRSGCGIAFRMAEDYSEYYAFMLGLDGKMNFYPKLRGANTIYLSKANWGAIDHMEGSATFIITAIGSTYQVFNDQLTRIDLRYGQEIVSGYLAYQLASGINTDFGTRCTFTDTRLWRFDE